MSTHPRLICPAEPRGSLPVNWPRRQAKIGTRWRRLPAGHQALLALAHLRCGDTYAQLAGGFGIGIATVYRCIREAVEALARAGEVSPLNESQAQMVLKTFRFGFHEQERGAMLISTRNTIVSRGYCHQAAKETNMFGTMGPGAMIAAAVTAVAIAGLAIVAVRWFRARER